jgi:hypothetical protein
MTSNVVCLAERRPHLTGEAVCLACKHEWVGVAPIGTVDIECPECKSQKGVLKHFVHRDGLHYLCNCGNPLLFATPDGCYCANCGVWADL